MKGFPNIRRLLLYPNFPITVLLCSCEKEEQMFSYTDCCSLDIYEYSLDEANIYMPNLFSPNFDGINDIFLPICNEKVISIADFIIKDFNSGKLLYSKKFMIPNDNDNAWKGILYNGSLFKGKFTFSFTATTSSTSILKIQGEACAIKCEESSKSLHFNSNCHFPDQAGLDTTGIGYSGKQQIGLETSEQFCD